MTVDTPPAREEFVAEKPEPEDESRYARNSDGTIRLKADGTPALRRGRHPGVGSKKYTAGPTRARSLESQIGGLLFTLNAPLMMIPMLQRDALDTIEVTALAKAIDQECQRNARFRKYVESALKVQGATSLFSVVGLIAARRVIRHDIITIPADMGGNSGVDATLGALISTVSGQGIINPNLTAMQQEATG